MKPPPRWAEQYLGIPFKLNGQSKDGADCVGLCQLVMQEQAHIIVSRGDIYVGDLNGVPADLFQQRAGHPPWTTIIKAGSEKTFDWALMWSIGTRQIAPLHVGVVVAPGWILHVQEDLPAVLEQLQHLKGRVILFVRHDQLAP